MWEPRRGRRGKRVFVEDFFNRSSAWRVRFRAAARERKGATGPIDSRIVSFEPIKT